MVEHYFSYYDIQKQALSEDKVMRKLLPAFYLPSCKFFYRPHKSSIF